MGFASVDFGGSNVKSLLSEPSFHPEDQGTMSSLLRRKPNQLPKDIMPFANALGNVLESRMQKENLEFFIALL